MAKDGNRCPHHCADCAGRCSRPSGSQHPRSPAKQRLSFSSTFPMFPPSLSCYMVVLSMKLRARKVFLLCSSHRRSGEDVRNEEHVHHQHEEVEWGQPQPSVDERGECESRSGWDSLPRLRKTPLFLKKFPVFLPSLSW